MFSINDWEQDEIDSPDKELYPFNLKPRFTTFQFMPVAGRPGETMVDIWEPYIQQITKKLLIAFPYLNLKFVRNSSLKYYPAFRKLLIENIQYPGKLSEIFEKNTNKKVLPGANYVSSVCKKCHCARNEVSVKKGEYIEFFCSSCGSQFIGKLTDFEYWWYHKPLFIARAEIFKPQLAISGGDHYKEGDFIVRQAMAKVFSPNLTLPDMIFTPLLLTPDGQRMSKSRGNARFGNLQKIIDLADKIDSANLLCPEEAFMTQENFYENYNFGSQPIRLWADR